MPTNNSLKIRSEHKVRSIVVPMILCVCVVTALVIVAGRIPVSGHVSVSQEQSERFGQIMKENGVIFWTGISGLGMMGVQFDNPLALTTVDDEIIEDARRNQYQVIVKYNCLIPYFDHSVMVH